jgi:predicted component of type VI protein secretion system
LGLEVTITHLSGGRKGAVDTFSALPLKVGRSPECELKFDPEADARVSAVHAELRSDGDGGLVVVDLGSKNGLLLNGAKVGGEAKVPNHATIEVGEGGPRVKVTFEATGGISFGKLKRPDAPEAAAVKHDLKTTDEKPVFREEDLAPRRPPPPPGGTGRVLQGILILLVVGTIAAVLWWKFGQ